MCSIEPVRHATIQNINKRPNRPLSLKLIEKRLNHLRQELQTLNAKDFLCSLSNSDGAKVDEIDDHYVQYRKRLAQLLRSHDRQLKNLNLWRFHRVHTIEQTYMDEKRHSDEAFRTKTSDFKSKLLSTYGDKRRHLDLEQQNVNIRHRQSSDSDQYLFGSLHNPMNENHFYDGHNYNAESLQSMQRPTYNLRRAAASEIVAESSTTSASTSLKDLSIFSGTNSLLPLSSGIELQRCLSTSDIEQDLKDVRRGLKTLGTSSASEQALTENQTDETSLKKSPIDVRIEDGRLWYQRAWFSRNSPILLVFDDLEIVPALVLTVGRNDLLIRRSGTNIKHRVSLSLLYDGHLSIRKRGCIF